MEQSIIKKIQEWYKSQIDGDWEHSFGLTIDTIDNPGWHVVIDLSKTDLEKENFQQKVDNGDQDWYSIEIKNNVYEGFGDADKLELILQTFVNDILNKVTK